MRRATIVHATRLAALGVVVVAVFALVVLGVGHVPTSGQWTVLAFSMLAAAVIALLYQPVSARLAAVVKRQMDDRDTPDEMLRTFGSRLAMPIALDELLLQLAESLRRTLAVDFAEVWTGSGGILERSAADPDVGPGSLILEPKELAVVARARVPAHAWLSVWLPSLVAGRSENVRVAPITHSGELLGLILVERAPETEPLRAEDEQVLTALARQVGLALSNVRVSARGVARRAENPG